MLRAELKKRGGLVSPVCESTLVIKQIESKSWIRNIFSLPDQKNIDENIKKDFSMRHISRENAIKQDDGGWAI